MQFNRKPSFFSVPISGWWGYWWREFMYHLCLFTQHWTLNHVPARCPCITHLQNVVEQYRLPNTLLFYRTLGGHQTCNPSIGISNTGPSLLLITSKLMAKNPWTKYQTISDLGHLINRAVIPNRAAFTLWNFSMTLFNQYLNIHYSYGFHSLFTSITSPATYL